MTLQRLSKVSCMLRMFWWSSVDRDHTVYDWVSPGAFIKVGNVFQLVQKGRILRVVHPEQTAQQHHRIPSERLSLAKWKAEAQRKICLDLLISLSMLLQGLNQIKRGGGQSESLFKHTSSSSPPPITKPPVLSPCWGLARVATRLLNRKQRAVWDSMGGWLQAD